MLTVKEFFKDVKKLVNACSFTGEAQIFFVLKAVLIKYLYDNQYIDQKINDLTKDFTINGIVSEWAGYKVCYFEEKEVPPISKDCLNAVLNYTKYSKSFKGINSNVIGLIYEKISSEKTRKSRGMFYTPSHIIKHMMSILTIDFTKEHRFLDPACGSGFFLSALYDEMIIVANPLSIENRFTLHQLILSNQLFGMDKDPIAVLITKLVLNLKHPTFVPTNRIILKDVLLESLDSSLISSFDYILGNPPYIGHKMLDRKLSIALKEKYNQVFYDKGDLSYCFFPLGLSLLKENGQLIYICSRYFLESLSGKGLRKYISDNAQINTIVDFNGNRLIKGAKVDLVILHLTKKANKQNPIQVFKLREGLKVENYEEIFNLGNYSHFNLMQKDLKEEGWTLIDRQGQNIIDKIHRKALVPLGDICSSYQGIITGCDKAFIIEEEDKHQFEQSFMVPWIKSKNVEKFYVTPSRKILLYTDSIENIHEHPVLENHISPFKEVLSQRRECKKGIRKWHMLQWGRKRENFQRIKILFPYKSSINRFALDEKSLFFSADVYSMVLKENLFAQKISLEFLVCILNSSLYEFYFKTIGKKLGGTLYEYYPNTLMRLKIPITNFELVDKLKVYYDNIKYQHELGNKEKTKEIMDKIDNELYEYFELNDKDIDYLKHND